MEERRKALLVPRKPRGNQEKVEKKKPSKKSRLEIDLTKQWKLRFPPHSGLQFMNPANKEELTVSSKSRPDFAEEVKKVLPPRPRTTVFLQLQAGSLKLERGDFAQKKAWI